MAEQGTPKITWYDGDYDELVEVIDDLVIVDKKCWESADRDRDVIVGEAKLNIGQSVHAYGGFDEDINFSSLCDGSWFRNHINQPEATTLFISTDQEINNFVGSWTLPLRRPVHTDVLNIGLLDPFEMEIIPSNDPYFSKDWDRISAWLLDQLDEDSAVTYDTSWSTNNRESNEAVVAIEKEVGFKLFGATVMYAIRGCDEEFNNSAEGVEISFSTVEEQADRTKIYLLRIAAGQATAVDWSHRAESPIDPFSISPDLSSKLSRIVREIVAQAV